jgi:ligand-binding sensor domain-containing protein
MSRIAIVLFVMQNLLVEAQLPAASFQHLRRDFELFSSSYCTLAEDQYGFMWFGSLGGGGLYRYDGYNLKSFQTDPNHLKTTLASSIVNEIYLGPDSLLYIGTYFGITVLNPLTGQMESFNNIYDYFPDVRMGITHTFLKDTVHDVLWIGTSFGLAKMKPGDPTSYASLRPDKPGPSGNYPEGVSRILQDPKQKDLLWLATTRGLYQYDIKADKYTNVEIPGDTSSGMFIMNMAWDDRNVLWLATHPGNVMGLDPASGQWKKYSIPVSPSVNATSKEVFRILPDGNGMAWISTRSTVGKLNLDTGEYQYWEYDPLMPDGLMGYGAFRDLLNDRHGRLWIASWKGIQIARQNFGKPSDVARNVNVTITGVEAIPVYEQSEKPLVYSNSIQFRKDQRDITFQYVLPNPLDPGTVRYQYMLKGYDKDWITTDQRVVRYSRLQGGDYTFMVRGKERDDQDWTVTTSLEVSIPKRIAEFWWFWVVMGVIAISLIILIKRFLLSRAKKEAKLKAAFEHQLSEIQMQALRAQMNPHFLFNSLNSIKYFAISKSKDETAAYLSKFAMLVRAILNNSKERTISLKDELDALQLYIEIEHLRLEGKFEYNIDIDSGIHIRQAQIPPMILQPYVENAIWHGLMHKDGKGRLLVQVKDLGQTIQCIIEDNGIGRARSEEIRKKQTDHKKSVGMQITGDRIALINKIYRIDTQVHIIDLADADGNAKGTRVVINIPLIRDEEE